MGEEYSHLSFDKREELAKLLIEGKSIKEISSLINLHISTIYREIDRGMNPSSHQYDPEYAEKNYRKKLSKKGKERVLSENKEMASAISRYILSENLSPEQVIVRLKQEGYNAVPSKQTIYAAIETGIIPGISVDNLHSKETKISSDGIVYIPKWIREELKIADGDAFTLTTTENSIILTKK